MDWVYSTTWAHFEEAAGMVAVTAQVMNLLL